MRATQLIFALSMFSATGMVLAGVPAKQADAQHQAVSHQTKDTKHNRQHGFGLKRALARLELTDSQQQQINQLIQQHRNERASKADGSKADSKAEYRASHQQLKALMAADQFDEVAARQLLAQRQQAKLERQLAGMKLRHDIMQLLTEEQRQQLQLMPLQRRHNQQSRQSS
ncbi:MAG: Spy/CpxP family protein refolding chaperone [Chromatiaceae bacterium]|nr:Spy/CpxP family protein refolding chaperone [Chromatiaceae bacterium]